MLQSELDKLVVAARRDGKLAGHRLRFNQTFEQLFFHYPSGEIKAIPIVFRGTRQCSDGSAYDEYGPSKQPHSSLDAVIHTHEDQAGRDQAHFPFPGTLDGVVPSTRHIPNYGIFPVSELG